MIQKMTSTSDKALLYEIAAGCQPTEGDTHEFLDVQWQQTEFYQFRDAISPEGLQPLGRRRRAGLLLRPRPDLGVQDPAARFPLRAARRWRHDQRRACCAALPAQ